MTLRIAAVLAVLSMAAAPQALEPSVLQSRIEALAQQVHLRYGAYPPALKQRRDAMSAALTAWNDAVDRGGMRESNSERMADWIDAALRAVMAGGSGQFPPTPVFDVSAPGVQVAKAGVKPAPSGRAAEEAPLILEPLRAPRATRKDLRPEATTFARGPAVAAKSQFTGPRATAQRVAKPAVESPPERVASPQRSKWSRHPAAAPLDWGNPFASDPSASENPLRSGRHGALRPTFGASGVRIDLPLLAAELRGYNAAVRSLQATLHAVGEQDVEALVAAADELEQLSERRAFLELYLEGLSEGQRNSLPDSASIGLVRELVRRKVQSLVAQPANLRPEDHRTLRQLSERLAAGNLSAASR